MLFEIDTPTGDTLAKVVIGGLITGGFTFLVALIRFLNSHRQRQADRENSMRETGVEHSKDLTNRMENLMGAYEAHIRDLSADLVENKNEVRRLRAELDALRAGGKSAPWGEADAG